MNNIEEQIWNYIDGNCTPKEQAEVAAKIASDGEYKQIYEQLFALNAQLGQLDFEEPSMSFTRNVMQQVNAEPKPVALKTKVDNRIVYGIAALFGFSLLFLFAYAIAISDFSTNSFTFPKYNFNFDKMITPLTIKAFFLVDMALALLYLDVLIRKGKATNSK